MIRRFLYRNQFTVGLTVGVLLAWWIWGDLDVRGLWAAALGYLSGAVIIVGCEALAAFIRHRRARGEG